MKYLVFIILLSHYPLFSQSKFIFSPITPYNNIIVDAVEKNDTVFALQSQLESYYTSDLLLLKHGLVLNQYKLSNVLFHALRIISINDSQIILIGRLRSDTCMASVTTAKYNYLTDEFVILSSLPFCDKSVQNLRLTRDLHSGWLINGYWVDNGSRNFVLKMDTAYQLTFIIDSLIAKRATVDFSRKGYLLKDESFCHYYDKDFNFRKDRYSINEGINNTHQTHLPYGDHFILESFSGSPDYENTGHYVRIIDSLLRVQKLLYVTPGTEDHIGGFEPPFFGGIAFIDSSSFWMSGNNNLSSNPQKPTHYSITRVNENLEIDCNQYLGFDAYYRIYGLNATTDGGVIVYGMKFNETYDPYLIKLGPNCELPTVSTTRTDGPLISVSVYPNPGINEVSFDIQGFDPTTLRMELINVQGQVLFSADDLSHRIEVVDLPAGQYFYRILQKDRLLGVGGWVKE